MKKILAITLILVFINSTFVFANEVNFSDINNHWAKENIVRMAVNGNVKGYEDGTFKPNNSVTTLEFIKILFESFNIKLKTEGLNKWPDYYIATAKEYNLPTNYYEKLTRYEATEIIAKVMDLKNVSAGANKFKDLKSKYKNNVLKLVKLKVINGYEDKTFRGENLVSRAEAVTIIQRAYDASNKISLNKEKLLDEKYTNIGFKPNLKSEYSRNRYEIRNGKIHFKDDGRFEYLDDYVINEKYVTNKKLINVIESFASKDSYTAVLYAPSKYVINQIIISNGEDDINMNRGLSYFKFIYYEDKLYDLQRISLKEIFSNECFMKIEITKLWKDFYKYQNGELVDESIKNRLLEALKVEFDNDANKILDYMLDKYIREMNKEYQGETITEKTTIGNYIINFYKRDVTSLEFYFEKLSS